MNIFHYKFINRLIMNTLGERIKYVIKQKGVKVISIAEILGKNQTTISSYIINRAYPSGDFFITLKQIVPDLDLNWLITGKGDPYIETSKTKEVNRLIDEVNNLKARERELTDALLKVIGTKTPLAKSKGVYAPANLFLHENRLWFDAKHTVNYTPRFAH